MSLVYKQTAYDHLPGCERECIQVGRHRLTCFEHLRLANGLEIRHVVGRTVHLALRERLDHAFYSFLASRRRNHELADQGVKIGRNCCARLDLEAMISARPYARQHQPTQLSMRSQSASRNFTHCRTPGLGLNCAEGFSQYTRASMA